MYIGTFHTGNGHRIINNFSYSFEKKNQNFSSAPAKTLSIPTLFSIYSHVETYYFHAKIAQNIKLSIFIHLFLYF